VIVLTASCGWQGFGWGLVGAVPSSSLYIYISHTIALETLAHQTEQHLAAEITEGRSLVGMHIQAVGLEGRHLGGRIQYGYRERNMYKLLYAILEFYHPST